MKNLTVFALLAALTAAAPFVKRDFVYETITQEVIQTVDVTTTIWIKAIPTSVAASLSAAPPATTTESALNGKFFDHSYSSWSSSAAAAVVPTTSGPAPASSAPSSSPSPSSPSSSAAYAPPPAIAAPATTEAPSSTYVPPPVSSYAPPPSSAPAPAPVPSSSVPSYGGGSGSGSPSGQCTSSSPCSGDGTHYDAGTGSCGWQSNGQEENVIAMPHGMMGHQANDNSFCGKTVTIKYGDKKVTAKVVDKCMGCVSSYHSQFDRRDDG